MILDTMVFNHNFSYFHNRNTTMVRKNRPRLSDSEIKYVELLKQEEYGDVNVPKGVVIADACRKVLMNNNDEDNIQL